MTLYPVSFSSDSPVKLMSDLLSPPVPNSNAIDSCLTIFKFLKSGMVNTVEFRKKYQEIQTQVTVVTGALVDSKDYINRLNAFLKPILLASPQPFLRLTVDFMLHVTNHNDDHINSVGVVINLLRRDTDLQHIKNAVNSEIYYIREHYSYEHSLTEELLDSLGAMCPRLWFESSNSSKEEVFLELLNKGCPYSLQRVTCNWVEGKFGRCQTVYYLAIDALRGYAKVLVRAMLLPIHSGLQSGDIDVARDDCGRWQCVPQPPATSSSLECVDRFLSFAYQVNQYALSSVLLPNLNPQTFQLVLDYIH